MSIASIIANAALGPVLDTVRDLGKAWLNKEVSEEKFKSEIEQSLHGAMTKLWSEQSDVIKAEIQSESWITSHWRPIVALSAAWVLIGWYAFLVPILVGWFGMPPLAVGDVLLEWLYAILFLCLGGYMALRSVYDKRRK